MLKIHEPIYPQIRQSDRIIMHIDYDSFFASVEQQANPHLRNKPIAVGGSSVRKGIVCAASKEAKKFGVRTGMPLFKAKELCPDIIPIKGDGTKYKYIQKRSLEIFRKYTDLIEPFSIDEAFLDITETVKFFNSAEDTAKLIKKDILASFGKYITCSIGIGPNKLVAKLVSDLEKPDGLVIADEHNLQEILRKVDLRAFCGIGPRLEERLNQLGITTVEQLQNTPLHILYSEFGNVAGSFLKNTSFGIHIDTVKSGDYMRPVKSISHQHTLRKNTKDPKVLLMNLRRLTEMVAKRLRKHEMLCKTVHLSLRDAKRNWYGHRSTLSRHTSSGTEIYQRVEKLFWELNWEKDTRLVGIGAANLIHEKHKMEPLFLEDKRIEKINLVVDQINDKWGDFVIMPASTLNSDDTRTKISSFLKHD